MNLNDPEYTQTSLYIRDIQHYHSAVQKERKERA